MSYAPLASPAFTGTPIAPTATAGTNTTQIATTAFVVANALANPNPTLKGTTNFQTTGGTQLAHVDGTTGNYINDRGGGGDTYVGNLAGPNHTGQFSTFVGYQAGQNITTGDQNTALGVRTLNAATGSCSSNTAVGYGAMWDATTACNSNTAVGYNAMTGAANYATTSNNTAAGANALGAIGSNASGNAALGAQAGSINATGNNNTYVGYQAGNSGGGAPTRNTYVGYNANDNTAANYTQSTALGANARITASNQIVLGTATETTSIPGILAVTGAAIFGTIPTTQTATAGDNSTKVATTTFVQNALQSGLATCNGRLTLRSGDPVNAPGSSGGTLYFTPFNGNIIALYDGSTSWGFLTFAEKSLAVPVSTGVYDLFAYNNAGVVALETQAWTNISTRASNLAFQDGVYVKVGATTRRYLGTFYSASGTVSDIKAARNLFSYYNRVGKVVYNQDPGPDYPYTSIANVMSPMHSGSTGWRIYVVVGVQDNAIDIKVSTLFTPNTADVRYYIGVGLNQTTANNANYGVWRMDLLNIPMSLYTGSLSSPPLGYNFYNGLEQLTAGTSGTAFPTQATCGISGYWSC